MRELSHQWFLRNPVTPVGGVITLDDRPGLGMALDAAKIEEQRALSWTETRRSYAKHHTRTRKTSSS